MSAQSSNLETLLRAAFAAGISYADGINENGIETVWQMRKDELVPAVETPTEPARLTDVQCDDVIEFLADYEWSGLTRDNVRTWDQAIRDAVKTTPDTPKC